MKHTYKIWHPGSEGILGNPILGLLLARAKGTFIPGYSGNYSVPEGYLGGQLITETDSGRMLSAFVALPQGGPTGVLWTDQVNGPRGPRPTGLHLLEGWATLQLEKPATESSFVAGIREFGFRIEEEA